MKHFSIKSKMLGFSIAMMMLTGSLAQAEPFKEAMGLMGKSMKVIVSDFKSNSVNQGTLDSANRLSLGCQNALSHLPPDFANDDEFVGPIRKVCEKAQQLVVSLQSSDLKQAQMLVSEMLQLKESSHDKYRQ